MTAQRAIKAALLAGVCLLPFTAGAWADDNFDIGATPAGATAAAPLPPANDVSVGVGGVVGVNNRNEATVPFGRYNGVTDSGPGFVSNLNLNNRDAWDSGGTYFSSGYIHDLDYGFGRLLAPETSAGYAVGQQGQWSLNAFYDAMTYEASQNFTSILTPSGALVPQMQKFFQNNNYFVTGATSFPTSPSTGSPGAPFVETAANASHCPPHTVTTACVASAKTGSLFTGPVVGSGMESSFDVGTRRDLFGAGGKYQLGNWLFTAKVSDEHKEGTLEQTMTTGGSNSGMVAFPMPVNYDTENYNVSAAYNTKLLQAKLSYNFSNFIDHNSTGYQFEGWNFVVINTHQTPSTTPSFNSYEMSGVYSLPPNNQAHTISGEVGYNIDSTTRLNATAVYSLQLQNDPFVAATDNAYITSNPGYSYLLAKNPASLNGAVNTYFANLALTSRPMSALNVKASYTVDAREPMTAAQWIYGDPTDTAAANPNVTGNAGTSLKYREAVPESWVKQTLVLEAGYKVLPDTRVTLNYTLRDAERENAITHHTLDNEGSIKVNQTITNELMASLRYLHADRSASAPDFSLWNTQINSDCGSNLSTATLGCQQVPFYEAARTEDAVEASLMGDPVKDLSTALIAKFTNNDYHNQNALYVDNSVVTSDPSVGINRDYSISVGPNASYKFSKDIETHLYYSFIRTYRSMRALNNGSSVTTAGDWEYSENSTYDIHTAGIGGTWQANEKLKFGADYIFSYGSQAFIQAGSWTASEGTDAAGDPRLTTKSADNQFRIHASYNVTDKCELYLGYQFDSLDMSDWALTGATVGQVLTGDVPAKYNVSTILAAVKYSW